MIKNIRDIIISLFVLYIFIVIMTARMSPEWVGEWKANVDIAYDSIWMEYIADCDCTEPLE